MGCTDGGSEADGCCFQLRAIQDSARDVPGGSVGELGNNNCQFPQESEHKSTFQKKQRVDLSFEEIRFSVREWSLKNPKPVRKEILKGVSGIFPAGELTAIMGPSGAGKSTLLNVLAAFTLRGSSGRVMLNHKERDPVKFKKQSCYIQQDDYLRMELTVAEAMSYATNLKQGRSLSLAEKQEQIEEILKMLGLSFCLSTPCWGLSGGQKKRLSIALELISNPPVIFLDEPTTGLDSSSCTLCVLLLKFLAEQGRTVVCTIHQPSSLVFEKIDNLYALSEGRCVYSGKVKELVPYLAGFGLHCPQYHNPADFLLDVAIGDYEANLQKLSEAAEINVTKAIADAKIMKIGKGLTLLGGENNNQYTEETDVVVAPTAASLIDQTLILTCRKLRIIRRSPWNMLIRAASHLLIALLFGYLYMGSGNNADKVLANYVYVYGTNLFLVYTGKMSATLLFPMEFLIVTREHFNKWYQLGPYYVSMMLIEIPFQIVCSLLYLPISYYLTGNPMETDRLLLFCTSSIVLSLISQGAGFLIGLTTPRKIAVFVGPCFACLLSIFGFCLRYSDTPFTFKWLYHASYFRAAFHNTLEAIYGYGREKIPCPDESVHCVFSDPRILLREMDAVNIDVELNSMYSGICLVIVHILTIVVVWYKLNRK